MLNHVHRGIVLLAATALFGLIFSGCQAGPAGPQDQTEPPTDRTPMDPQPCAVTLTLAGTQVPSATDVFSPASRGCDRVFFLNPDAASIGKAVYVVDLGSLSADVHVIATNTTDRPLTATIERIDDGDAVGSTVQIDDSPIRSLSVASALGEDGHLGDTSWQPLEPGTTGNVSPAIRRASVLSVGDTFDFRDSSGLETPATVRQLATDGTITFVVWVADADWGACSDCVDQGIADVIAREFLSPGPNNDIYDWVTAVLGPPWGPHNRPGLIPPEYADRIHVLIKNYEGGNAYHSRRNVQLRNVEATSNERLMLVLNGSKLKDPDALAGHRERVSTVAHEFQHMINHYHKWALAGVVRSRFLNEGTSYVVQDLVANKIRSPRPRWVAYDDPTAGSPGIEEGRLPLFNRTNDMGIDWDSSSQESRAMGYALTAYLARNYGGAPLVRDIVHSDHVGREAIEAGLRAQGHTDAFGEILANWAVATALSDNTETLVPYRYNSGTWSTSEAGGVMFQLGSINLFNYGEGPVFDSLRRFNSRDELIGYSNTYVTVGRNTGTVRLEIAADAGSLVTMVVKRVDGMQDREPTVRRLCAWNTEEFFETATTERVTACIDMGADVNVRDSREETPLHFAAKRSEEPEIIAALVSAGADVDARNVHRETPLHRAAQFNDRPAIIAALLAAGADVEARRSGGRAPLHMAAQSNDNPDVTAALLEGGGNVNSVDDQGRTPLDVARNPAVIAVLQAAGAECGAGRVFGEGMCS